MTAAGGTSFIHSLLLLLVTVLAGAGEFWEGTSVALGGPGDTGDLCYSDPSQDLCWLPELDRKEPLRSAKKQAEPQGSRREPPTTHTQRVLGKDEARNGDSEQNKRRNASSHSPSM